MPPPDGQPALRPRGTLSSELTPVVLGGAAWSHQINANPETLPVIPVLLEAFSSGIRTLDTSPYYEPSEKILGAALSSADITSRYQRQDYVLMTKVGRVKSEEFDYSPAWVRKSVERSLDRFRTGYLDVVFCHDVEFVSEEAVVGAVGVLWEFVAQGKVRYVGVSGYPVHKLVSVARKCKEAYGKPLDIVQNWGHLTLQNTKLKEQGLGALAEAGVGVVCSSSPLNIGLLRAQGVPVGTLGDWHPAPPAMRAAAAKAAAFVEGKGDDLASVALRFAFAQSAHTGQGLPVMATIIGPGSVEEVKGCAKAAWSVRKKDKGRYGDLRDVPVLDQEVLERDRPLVEGVREILGEWIDYSFASPPPGWDVESGKMVGA